MPTFESHRNSATFWEDGYLRLFISHLAVEKHYAIELKKALARYEISGFVARQDIAPTAEWQNEIKKALLTCDSLVALLHKGFHASKWTDQEIGYVMGRKRPVCAVLLGEKHYGFIGHHQALHGQGKDARQIAMELFRAFCHNRQTAKRMSEVAVRLFVSSDNWADASDRLTNLEMLSVWDSTFTDRIEHAAQHNNQILFSPGVAERLDKLLAKWSKRPSKSV
jgi:hypothetical protein